ncbi:hypothetical protein CDH05_02240 [Pseudomonas lactis]|nr:hypothetical protein CDH05_02240 [Pseudomonas lactis]
MALGQPQACRLVRRGQPAAFDAADSAAPVGASLLAKIVNDNAGSLVKRGVLASFASKLAPTV